MRGSRNHVIRRRRRLGYFCTRPQQPPTTFPTSLPAAALIIRLRLFDDARRPRRRRWICSEAACGTARHGTARQGTMRRDSRRRLAERPDAFSRHFRHSSPAALTPAPHLCPTTTYLPRSSSRLGALHPGGSKIISPSLPRPVARTRFRTVYIGHTQI